MLVVYKTDSFGVFSLRKERKMNETILQEKDFLARMIDAIPSMVLVVDRDFKVCRMNQKAWNVLGENETMDHRLRGGDFLRCVNAVGSEFRCGSTDSCPSCQIRSAIQASLENQKTFHGTVTIRMAENGSLRESLHLLTATPFDFEGQRFALLVRDDLKPHQLDRELVPICAQCKKIRGEQDDWETIEKFVTERLDLDFSHTICPQCLAALYPSFYKG